MTTRTGGTLAVQGITKRFAGLVALDNITLQLEQGEILGIMGPNGSGKSTLVNVMTGILPPEEGAVTVNGQDVTGWNPSKIAHVGVARSFQTVRLFRNLSVRDNVAAVIRGPKRAIDIEVDSLLETLGILELAERTSGDLAYGLQRRVEIARALATEPQFLLLDEPAAGLNDIESADLEQIIRELAKGERFGCGVMIIDHDMRLLTDLCDRLFVIANGRALADGPPAEVRENEAVIRAYLGDAHVKAAQEYTPSAIVSDNAPEIPEGAPATPEDVAE